MRKRNRLRLLFSLLFWGVTAALAQERTVSGTVTADVGQAVTDIRKGKIEFRVDKNANIHVPVGKASFDASKLQENAEAVLTAIIKSRPSTCKGTYLKSVTMSSTMGPGFKMDHNALASQYR